MKTNGATHKINVRQNQSEPIIKFIKYERPANIYERQATTTNLSKFDKSRLHQKKKYVYQQSSGNVPAWQQEGRRFESSTKIFEVNG